MKTTLKNVAFAALIAVAPFAHAGTDDVGGFQSSAEITKIAASAGKAPAVMAARQGTDATGFQSLSDIAEHLRNHLSTDAGARPMYSGTDATGIQSARDLG